MPKLSSSLGHLPGDSRRDPLLKTKLYIPQLRPNCVPRLRLTQKLAQALTHPLTLISAPAGFGKTTLISEWQASLADDDFPLAWLSLDEDDNDVTRFWAYVIAALQTLQPEIGAEALTMLHASWRRPSLPKAFLTSLINDLTQLNVDGVLVLDDYHVIESRLIHDALAYWLEHLPRCLHIILASRTDPALPLARLRARDQLVEIRAADLRFTAEEAALFLNQVTGLGLTPEDVAALETRTEGWIAGLQLAAIALQARLTRAESLPSLPSRQGRGDVSSFIAAFTGSNRYVLDYLVEEVLNRQPEGVQTFLMQTSILDQLCASLCDAVTDRSDSQTILTMLEQANLFTSPLDEERRWYRYHPLFAEFLHSRLGYTQPDHVPKLHRRAADWYERNGLIDDAVAHALAAQDWQQAARLVEQVSQTLLMRGEMSTLQNWLQALPDDLIRSRPRLCILMAWTHILELRMEVAEYYLRHADQLIAAAPSLTSEESASLESEMEAIRSVKYMFQGDTHRAAESARQALEHSSADNRFLRSIIALDMSFSQAMSGDAQTANQALTEAIRLSQQAQNTMVAVISMAQLAEQYIAQGHLHQAAELYQQAIQLADDQNTPPPPVISMAYNGLGEVLREWNQLTEATQSLNKGIELGRRWNSAMSMDGYISLARVNQAQGDTEAALEMMHQTHELARRFESVVMGDMMISTFDVRLWIVQGNLESIAHWAQELEKGERIPWAESPYPYLIREMTQLILAHAQLALDKPEETLALIEQLAPEAETRGRRGIVIELTMLKALARQALGEMPQALAALEQALAQAEPEGYVRLFVDKGEPMKWLIADFRLQIEKQTGGESKRLMPYIDKLLNAFPEAGPVSKSGISDLQSKISGPLSERELEVLRMIAAGLSNQEIADRLVVAPSTIKTHIKNLYNKLGVNSRVQAITRAQELGLL